MYQPVIAHYTHVRSPHEREIGSRRETRRGHRFFISVKIFAATEPAAFTRVHGIWQETWNVLQHARSENLGRRREEKRARSLTERVLKIPAKPEGLRQSNFCTCVQTHRYTYRMIHCGYCTAAIVCIVRDTSDKL